MTCARIFIILPSRSSGPRAFNCFSCNKALYTSNIVTGGMAKVEVDKFKNLNHLALIYCW